jgi:hypothetical protein
VTAEDGPVGLERTANFSWATRVVSESSSAGIPGLSLETLLTDHGIAHVDLLKVDIEGLEHEALARTPSLERTTFVIGEIHPDLLSVPTDQALEEMRRCGGFDSCELDGGIFVLSRAGARPAAQT